VHKSIQEICPSSELTTALDLVLKLSGEDQWVTHTISPLPDAKR